MDDISVSVESLCSYSHKIHSERQNKTAVIPKQEFDQILINELCKEYDVPTDDINIQHEEVQKFSKRYMAYWEISKRCRANFLKKYSKTSWYISSVKFYESKKKDPKDDHQSLPKTCKRGRPTKPYEECGASTKRKKINEFCENVDLDEAFEILKHLLRKNQVHQKVVIIEFLQKSTNDCDEVNGMIKVARFKQNDCLEFTTTEDIALYMDLDLTYRKYSHLRSSFLKKKYCGLPPYEELAKGKNACVPSNMTFDAVHAKFSFQSVLDHTAHRIMNSIMGLDEKICDRNVNLVLFSKWGCDGSSGQSQYKQKLDNDFSDTNLFMVSVVPLRITEDMDLKNSIWKNNTPSSTKYCRPVEFAYLKETQLLVKTKIDERKAELENLKETEYKTSNGTLLRIRHQLMLTMVDGKVAQAISGHKSTRSCVICHASQSEFSNTDAAHADIEEMYELGMSPLHARIRFMEHCLKTAYDLKFESCLSATDDFQSKPLTERRRIKNEMRAEEKQRIQNEFKLHTGLLIDFPKPGLGNSNDGNTARRFFKDVATTARITKLDESLLSRFGNQLIAINSRQQVDSQKFGEYAKETGDLYDSLYGNWKPMPPTLHKVLHHGSKIIEHHFFPIGELSEEAQESKNKEYKYLRLHHTRKVSREAQNKDLMTMLMLSSDPLISSLRKKDEKIASHKELPPEIEYLLIK